MTKYIKDYDSVSAATGDVTVVSPNLTYVYSGDVNKLLMLDTGTDDEELEIIGNTIPTLIIRRKVTEAKFDSAVFDSAVYV